MPAREVRRPSSGGEADRSGQLPEIDARFRNPESDLPQIDFSFVRFLRRRFLPPPLRRSRQDPFRRPFRERSRSTDRSQFGKRGNIRGCLPFPRPCSGMQDGARGDRQGEQAKFRVRDLQAACGVASCHRYRARRTDILPHFRVGVERPTGAGQVGPRFEFRRRKAAGDLQAGGRILENSRNLVQLDAREGDREIDRWGLLTGVDLPGHGHALSQQRSLPRNGGCSAFGFRFLHAGEVSGKRNLSLDQSRDPGPDLEVVPPVPDAGQQEGERGDRPPGLRFIFLLQSEEEVRLLNAYRPQYQGKPLLFFPGGRRGGGLLLPRNPVEDIRCGVGAVAVFPEPDLRTAEDDLRELRFPREKRRDRQPDFGLRHRQEPFFGVARVPGDRKPGHLHSDSGKQ